MIGAPFPVRPTCLEIENFRGFRGACSLDFGQDLTLLMGECKAGKSSILTAIEWCLLGTKVVSSTSTGIAERGDWILANTEATGETRVTLTLVVEGGKGKLTRTRALDAKRNAPDQLELTLPGEQLLTGNEVEEWLEWTGMPNWDTWKQAFAQHQESARERITDQADRSYLIASMLGLSDYRDLSAMLKKVKPKELEECAQETLQHLAEDQQRARQTPQQEVNGIQASLQRLNVSATQAGDAELELRRKALIAEALPVGEAIGLSAEQLPHQDWSASEVHTWGANWRSQVDAHLTPLRQELGDLEGRIRSLTASHEALNPKRVALADARQQLEGLRSKHGSPQDLRAQRETIAGELSTLREQRREQGELNNLLREALGVIKASGRTDQCPVCTQDTGGLEQRLQEQVASGGDDAIQNQLDQLASRDGALSSQLQQLEQAQATFQGTEDSLASLEKTLRGQLPPGTQEEAGVTELLAALLAQKVRLEKTINLADENLAGMTGKLEVLGLLLNLRAARERAEHRAGDLSAMPQFAALQDKIDEAAGFACDLIALENMARELEEEQAALQIQAVNQSINHYMSMISPGFERVVSVHQKHTATKLIYQLVDSEGENLTGTLNQGALNSLSLATFFAGAQFRVSQGLPEFLVLDDPVQSLDQAHQEGLARAVKEFSKLAPVIIACLPSHFTKELERLKSPDDKLCRVHGSDPIQIEEI